VLDEKVNCGYFRENHSCAPARGGRGLQMSRWSLVRSMIARFGAHLAAVIVVVGCCFAYAPVLDADETPPGYPGSGWKKWSWNGSHGYSEGEFRVYNYFRYRNATSTTASVIGLAPTNSRA